MQQGLKSSRTAAQVDFKKVPPNPKGSMKHLSFYSSAWQGTHCLTVQSSSFALGLEPCCSASCRPGPTGNDGASSAFQLEFIILSWSPLGQSLLVVGRVWACMLPSEC